ncbi:MAG: PEP-CTERM sorting domain-containing protein [Phycisphaerales bacterium]|nr:PEP-CTERM sorting domain-containing protein [Phycisphaerales bacterium]
MERSQRPCVRNKTRSALLLAVVAMATFTLVARQSQATMLYDFDHLNKAKLGGQDGWTDSSGKWEARTIGRVTIDGKTNVHTSGAYHGSDTTIALYAGRKNGDHTSATKGTDWSYDLSSATGVTLSFVSRDGKPAWFALAEDGNSSGTVDETEAALWFGYRPSDYYAEIGTGSMAVHATRGLGSTSASGYRQFRLDVDFTANSGAGSATLYGYNAASLHDASDISSKNPTTELGMTTLLSNVNLGLTPDSHKTWDGLVIAGAGWGGPDELTVTSVVPEPATMSLLALGGLALLRRRRRA